MRLKHKIAAGSALAMSSLALVVPTASAQAPPGVPYAFAVPAGLGCTFTVIWSGHDATVLTPKPNGAVHSAGYYDVKLTNPANGKSVYRKAPGPGDFSPNGKVIYARGAWVAAVPPDAKHPDPRILFVDGGSFRILLRDGSIFKKSANVTTRDLCKKID